MMLLTNQNRTRTRFQNKMAEYVCDRRYLGKDRENLLRLETVDFLGLPHWHKGKEVINFIKDNGNIQVAHFPKCSPEENPQEHIWEKGRMAIMHNFIINDIDKMTDDFVNCLNASGFHYSLSGLKY